MPIPTRRKRHRGLAMPPEIRHIYTTGHLYAEEAHALGVRPVMTCVYCHGEVDLLATFEPLTDEQLTEQGRVLPMLTHGEGLMVLCPCCSVRPECPHKAAVPEEESHAPA